MKFLLLPRLASTFWGALAALFNAILRVLLVPLLVTPLFDQVLNQQAFERLPQVLLTAFGVILCQSLFLLIQDTLLGRTAALTSAYWRETLYASLLKRRPQHLPGTSGGLSSRILTDLKDLESYLQYGLGTLIAESLTMIGIVVVLLWLHPGATLLLILLSLPLFALLGLIGRHLERVSERSQASLEVTAAQLQEGLKHHSLIRAFFADRFMLGRFARASTTTTSSMIWRSVLAALQTPLAQVLIFVSGGSVLWLLTRSVAAGRMTVGEVATFITLFALLTTPVQLLPRGYALLQQARSAAGRLRALLEPERSKTVVEQDQMIVGSGLEFKGVSFGYQVDKPILAGLQLALPQQGLVALIGESGSGKTTLLQIILRFLEPEQGCIYLGGKMLSSFPEEALRSRVAYVPQGTDMLSGSLRDNLLLGRKLSEAKLWQVLQEVNLDEVIRYLPGQLDYSLQEDGLGLSGGQLQRLAVARALLSEPDVLLLDEPSANLDAESEHILVSALQAQAKKRLIVVVAHRPALIEAADRVLKLSSEGRFEEAG